MWCLVALSMELFLLGRTKPFIQDASGCTRILLCVHLANLLDTRAQRERDVIKMVPLWTSLECIPGYRISLLAWSTLSSEQVTWIELEKMNPCSEQTLFSNGPLQTVTRASSFKQSWNIVYMNSPQYTTLNTMNTLGTCRSNVAFSNIQYVDTGLRKNCGICLDIDNFCSTPTLFLIVTAFELRRFLCTCEASVNFRYNFNHL